MTVNATEVVNAIVLTQFGIAEIIAGGLVLAASMIAMSSIRLHYKHSKQPQIRNFTIRILLMIPIYGIEAWLAIVFNHYAVLFRVLREGYEAFVILSFMQLMLTYLGGPVALARDMSRSGKGQKHLPPLCCVRPWIGVRFVRLTLIGVLSYVPCSVFVMVLSLTTWFAGVYEEGEIAWKNAWVYCAFITNCSQMWALYCLVLFYQGTKEDLQPINPLPKFLCVKMIVFFTWWQGIMINMEFNIAHNPRSRAAILASEWAKNDQGCEFVDDLRPAQGIHRRSPRSLPLRLARAVQKGVNDQLEKFGRVRSGVNAAADEMMSGVNLLDIWDVLQQTKDLRHMPRDMEMSGRKFQQFIDQEEANVGSKDSSRGSSKCEQGEANSGNNGSGVVTQGARSAFTSPPSPDRTDCSSGASESRPKKSPSKRRSVPVAISASDEHVDKKDLAAAWDVL